MVGHQHVSNQFAGPPFIQCLERFNKGFATEIISEDWHPVEEIAGNMMESAGEIEVGPLASHVRKLLSEWRRLTGLSGQINVE